MRRNLFIFAIGMIWCSGSRASAQPVFVREFDLGANESGPIDALLYSAPLWVATDGDDRIFVGDGNGHRVLAYDSRGEYLYVMEDAGAAPGEIGRVSAAYLQDGRLWLVDEQNERFSVHDPADGTFIDTHPNPLPGWVRAAIHVDGSAVILSRKPDPSGDWRMLHDIDPINERVRSFFGSFDSMWDLPDEFRVTEGDLMPGNICATPSGEVVYAPRLYAGSMFGFTRDSSGWQSTRTLKGSIAGRQAYRVVNDELLYVSESRGLICLNDGYVIHFSMQDTGEKILTAELFSPSGDLMSVEPIDNIVFPGKEFWDFHVRIMPLSMDGRFVLTDAGSSDGMRRVRVGRLSWEALEARR